MKFGKTNKADSATPQPEASPAQIDPTLAETLAAETQPETLGPAADLFTEPPPEPPGVHLPGMTADEVLAMVRADLKAQADQIKADRDAHELFVKQEISSLRAHFEGTLLQLGAELDRVARTAAAGGPEIEPMRLEVMQLRGSLERIAGMLGRHDILYPPATAEQVEHALAQGDRLYVLKDYKTMGFAAEAGRILDAQAFDHRKIMDGVRSGRLSVSVMPKAKSKD